MKAVWLVLFSVFLIPQDVFGGESLFLSVGESLPWDENGACRLPACHSVVEMTTVFVRVSRSVYGISSVEADAFLAAVRSVALNSHPSSKIAIDGLLHAASALSALRDADAWVDLFRYRNDPDVRAAASVAVSRAERFIETMPTSAERGALERMAYSRRILILLAEVWKEGAEPKKFASR